MVTSKRGLFYHESDGKQKSPCGVYIFAEPDEVIEVEIEELEVTCSTGLVVVMHNRVEN